MGIFFVPAIVLLIFYTALCAGFVSFGRSRLIHGSVIMMISSALAAALWQMAQNTTAPSAGFALIVLFCLLTGAFLIGLGLFIGCLTKLLPEGSISRRMVGIAVLILPAALVGWGLYSYKAGKVADEKAKVAARAAFQSQKLTASFGDHSVTLPVAPSIHITHACREGKRICHTSFSGNTELNMASPDTLELVSIEFPKRSDINEELTRWCADRAEMLDSVWCEQPFEQLVGLSVTDTTSRTRDPVNWKRYPAPDRASSLICYEHGAGPSCEIKFELAPGIQGYVSTIGLTQRQASVEALKALPRITRVWAAMSGGP